MSVPLSSLSRPRSIAVVLAAVLATGVVQAPAARAAKPGPYTPPAAKPVTTVPVREVPAARPVAAKEPPPASERLAPALPKAGAADASLVRVAPVASARSVSAQAVTPVRVEVLDRAARERTGVHGVLLRLTGGGAAARSKITVSYGSFAAAYGADGSVALRDWRTC